MNGWKCFIFDLVPACARRKRARSYLEKFCVFGQNYLFLKQLRQKCTKTQNFATSSNSASHSHSGFAFLRKFFDSCNDFSWISVFMTPLRNFIENLGQDSIFCVESEFGVEIEFWCLICNERYRFPRKFWLSKKKFEKWLENTNSSVSTQFQPQIRILRKRLGLDTSFWWNCVIESWK